MVREESVKGAEELGLTPAEMRELVAMVREQHEIMVYVHRHFVPVMNRIGRYLKDHPLSEQELNTPRR